MSSLEANHLRKLLGLPEPPVPTLAERVMKLVENANDDSDPVLAPDAGQFIRVELLDHLEHCTEEDCDQETRLAVSTNVGMSPETKVPYCTAHVHVIFSDWMVGA